MAQIFIPPALRRSVGDARLLQIEAKTVKQAIEAIDREHPGFADRVIADGRLKPGIALAIGSRVSDLGLLEPVSPDDEVHFVMSVSGG